MIFTYGGLVGDSLATNPCWATLPISMVVLGSMLAANPISVLMQNRGRRTGFMLGALSGALGAAISAYGIYIDNFLLLLLGSFVTGFYMSAQGFYRFAAADSASDAYRPKAISYVLAAGLLSAMIGPQLGKLVWQSYAIPFLGVYLAIIVINLVGMGLFFMVDNSPAPTPDEPTNTGRTRLELLKTPRIAVAIIIGMVSYALMNLVMTSTPLAVVGCGFDEDMAANIVTAHVIAMYAPSFVTGHLITRFGVEKIAALGLIILAVAGAVAMQGVTLENFFGALILLGIGWNFGFIGATTMLAGAHEPHERGRIQGLNDVLVFGGVTMASLASGGLMNCSGGDAQTGWMSVNMTMVPFLMLAGGALLWLWLRPEED